MEVDNETQSVVDYAIADQEFTAIVSGVYQSAMVTFGTGAQTSFFSHGCDTLSLYSGQKDTLNFTPNPVYSFNPSGQCSVVMNDGKPRAGSVKVRLTGKIMTPGSQMILKIYNYSSAGIEYSCDSIVVTTKESNTGYVSFGVTLVNGKCKTAAYSILYKFNRTFTIYPKGDATGADMVTYIYGNAQGTNRTGTNFSATVEQGASLIKHKTCPYIDKGTMELTPEGFKTRTINFGDGTCDDEATFTVKENTVAFKLK